MAPETNLDARIENDAPEEICGIMIRRPAYICPGLEKTHPDPFYYRFHGTLFAVLNSRPEGSVMVTYCPNCEEYMVSHGHQNSRGSLPPFVGLPKVRG
jgi:hypothetical protein